MSLSNGDKSRSQIARKRTLKNRTKIRALVAATKAAGKAQADAKPATPETKPE